MTCEVEWAWLAGFVDGEGSFMVTHEGRKHVSPRLDIMNVSFDLIDKCHKIAGGGVTGPISKGAMNSLNKPVYRWSVRGTNLQNCIENILPFMVSKTEQASLCLLLRKHTIQGSIKGHYGRPRLTDEFKARRLQIRLAVMALNHRGTSPVPLDRVEALSAARQYLKGTLEIPKPFYVSHTSDTLTSNGQS